ncbi:NuoI/complex I 23 kDa subunit family protein [Ornithinimicrobium pekingense]|uniref:NADH-quinone oxidoreductase subunit I 2 n=1 Tax=Ornithinimicrobium pekingense TaxID=384677 RepID=A0ABQ2FDA1_9MICO|nr:NADH-quinone oxidoreductase subunit I [Ornithinimicrobium pekingense]GGK82273.1 NADH-quinone oxidoreductase subunit I 2 [Ornithinimicrobium pekingense]
MKGLFTGLRTTAKVLARGAHTQQYPHEQPELPERSRGVIALLEENCTSCMLCARECPDWCIYIDSHKETVPPETEGGRARQKNVLDRFEIDYSLCMYCGICIEVCPFDALFWAPDFAYAEGDIRNLLHDKERLGTWMERVPESAWPEGYQGYAVRRGAPSPDHPPRTAETREPVDVGPEAPKPQVGQE